MRTSSLLSFSINNKLQQPMAAHGVLVYAMKNHGTDVVSRYSSALIVRNNRGTKLCLLNFPVISPNATKYTSKVNKKIL